MAKGGGIFSTFRLNSNKRILYDQNSITISDTIFNKNKADVGGAYNF